MSDFDAKLERAQADGRITTHDADEVRRFADFLTEVGQVWRKHYPEDYALAVAERDARLAATRPSQDAAGDAGSGT